MFRGPTTARPGSEEKIRVMEHRYATCQPIFHKDDVQVRLERMDGGHGGPVATMPKSKPSCERQTTRARRRCLEYSLPSASGYDELRNVKADA